jgi:SLT domain-containing protein
MAAYDNADTAHRDFLYFNGKFQRVCSNFVSFFEQFTTDQLRIDGLSTTLEKDAMKLTVTVYGREFVAEMAALTNGSDINGQVDFSEVNGSSRRWVDSFIITSGGHITDQAGKTVMPVHDWSRNQCLFFLNLVHQGLSKPLDRYAPANG